MNIDQQSYLPKVILHEHLEGSVTPKIAKQLAMNNAINLPSSLFYPVGEYDDIQFPDGRYFYDESQFNEFITIYDRVASLIQTADDYYLITEDYLTRNAQQGLIYCELLISPYHMSASEVNGKVSWDSTRYMDRLLAITRAIEDVNQLYPLIVRLHAVGVRHLGPDIVYQTLQFVQQNPHDVITGFNIAGNELSYQFADFSMSHQLAKQLGLGRSYHAGEIGSDQQIQNAVKAGAVRIGHGIRAIDNEALIKQLIENKILLEISMTSNRILVPELNGDIHQHPIRKLYDKGVRIAINTDDAGIFGTDINKEYQIAQQTFQFTRIELLDITLCSLEAAFLEDEYKELALQQVYKTFTEDDIKQLQKYVDRPSISSALVSRLNNHLHYLKNYLLP
ncbi:MULTISPECIES: adenosine deaminase [Providencia]|uniref:adenosine deaminase n=1 Tax=Providencia TaxID=586 RepID=UPI000F7920C9|nr:MULTISPECIES: adenosine deaminase [Providencia]ELR5070360.1 adenosine deaminase [Providencia rettgeri]ELR5222254.1 adenosine deaminase [Providencia rettgeri]MBV2189431.1 adenosine deaminase [Providencia rettgeri]MDX7322191.1 adenosine deaminase [Providencia rettgeri]